MCWWKNKTTKRRKKNTQKELAKKISVRGTSISNYESGYRSPSLFALYNLAKYFDVPISDFFQEQNKGGDMKVTNSISAKETLELINKTWADKHDVMKLASCGETSAEKIKKDLTDILAQEGYVLPTNKVPMDRLVQYLKININYLKKVSKEQ